MERNIYKIGKELFITSDEEIKEGDWVLFISTNEVIKVPLGGFKGKVCKKIILTDNKDLIKDGVQAIDDEFLEWFVKNPSCEEVETEKVECQMWSLIGCNEDDFGCCGKPLKGCKIIIPKEEAKQETLEEASERCFEEIKKLNPKGGIKQFIRMAVNFGAKWQAERMYSEEEVLNFTQTIIQQYKFGNTNIEQLGLLKETLQTFKNK